MERRLAPGDLAVGLGIVALGVVVLWHASAIPETLVAQIGPRVFPYAVGAGLVALGGLLTVSAALGGGWSGAIEEDDTPLHYGSLAWLLAGLVANVVLIGGLANLPLIGGALADVPALGGRLATDGLGFVPASTIMFVLVARAYGSTRFLRNAAIGLALAMVAMIGFQRGFGVNIGGGVVDTWMLQRFDVALAAIGLGG